MKETPTQPRKNILSFVSPPSNFIHIAHADRSTPIEEFIEAVGRPVTPIDADIVPLLRKISSPASTLSGRGTLPGTMSSHGSATSPWGSGLSRGRPPSNLPPISDTTHYYLRPDSVAQTEETSRVNESPQFSAPSAPTNTRSLATVGYINTNQSPRYENLKKPDQQYYNLLGDQSGNQGKDKPKRPPPPRPAPPSRVLKPALVSQEKNVAVETVVFRQSPTASPAGTVAERESRHETTKSTVITAPNRITITLDRPNLLFSALSSNPPPLQLDEVVPLPSSIDSGVSEPPFEEEEEEEEKMTAMHESIGNDYRRNALDKIASDLQRISHQDNTARSSDSSLKTITDSRSSSVKSQDSQKKKNIAPPPPMLSDSTVEEKEELPQRNPPVPKPRRTKMSRVSPVELVPENLTSLVSEDSNNDSKENKEQESTMELCPEQLRLAPSRSQLIKTEEKEEKRDSVITRL